MIDLGPIEEIENGQMLRVDVADRRLCLINIDGKIYVLDDRCTHADFSLAEGFLDADAKEVQCPKHGALFDIETGQALCLPATRPVQKYEVTVKDGRILLEVEDGNV